MPRLKSTADMANTWDYGNLGVELKNNVKSLVAEVHPGPYNVGVDCTILMNSRPGLHLVI